MNSDSGVGPTVREGACIMGIAGLWEESKGNRVHVFIFGQFSLVPVSSPTRSWSKKRSPQSLMFSEVTKLQWRSHWELADGSKPT